MANLKRSSCHQVIREAEKKMKLSSDIMPETTKPNESSNVFFLESTNLEDDSLQSTFTSAMMDIIEGIRSQNQSKKTLLNTTNYTQTSTRKHYEKTTQTFVNHYPQRLNVATQTFNCVNNVACQTSFDDSYDADNCFETIAPKNNVSEISNSVSESSSHVADDNHCEEKSSENDVLSAAHLSMVRNSREEADYEFSSTISNDFTSARNEEAGEMHVLEESASTFSCEGEVQEKFATILEDNDLYEQSIINDEKIIVFESCLINLCQHIPCPTCSLFVHSLEKSYQGSVMKLSLFCKYNHKIHEWLSQPLRSNGLSPGDILLTASILCNGQTYQNFSEICNILNLTIPSHEAFEFMENNYLLPKIEELWLQKESEMLTNYKQQLNICAFGQYLKKNSNNCFNLIDSESKKVITLSSLNSTECRKVTNILQSCHNCLQKLSKNGINISTLITQKDHNLKKLMTNYPEISHQFDVWHFIQLFKKELERISQNQKILLNWVPFLCNHLWWCAKNCNHNIIFLKEMWISVLKHLCNIHEWYDDENYIYYRKCNHESSLDVDWLTEDSAAFKKLHKFITSRKFLNELKHLNAFCHFSDLNIYHSFQTKYIPKDVNLTLPQLKARTELAALNNNWCIDEIQHKPIAKEFNEKVVYAHSMGVGQWLKVNSSSQSLSEKYLQNLLEIVLKTNTKIDEFKLENHFVMKSKILTQAPISIQRDWSSGNEDDKKKKYRKYSNFALQQAISKVCQEGWTITKASREFHIPWSTIKGYVNRFCNENPHRVSKFAHPLMLSSI